MKIKIVFFLAITVTISIALELYISTIKMKKKFEQEDLSVLTFEQEARAKWLHKEAIIIFAHDHRYLPPDLKIMNGGVSSIFKLTTDGIDWKNRKRYEIPELTGWTRRYSDAMESVYRLSEDKVSKVMLIRTVSDIYKAKKEDKVGVIFGSEGARHLEGDITRLREFYRRGQREMQLFWPAGNQLFKDGHLTEFGREVIRECNRLGILIDLSHVNQVSPAAFWEALKSSNAPVIISHDAPKTMGGGELKDVMIKAIADSGGGEGVYALSFVTPDYIVNQREEHALATIEDLMACIDYVVKLVGVNHVALGGDWFNEDGYHYHWVLDKNEILVLISALVKKGWSDENIKKILGSNMLSLFEHVWKN